VCYQFSENKGSAKKNLRVFGGAGLFTSSTQVVFGPAISIVFEDKLLELANLHVTAPPIHESTSATWCSK
jgi:hypothetical protein